MEHPHLKQIHTGKQHDVDMTHGNVVRHLINFAFPLLIGNIFQQLYNTVDTWVVGNYVSNEAFSAVGTVGPIINMLIGFFMGLSSGAGVVISQYYGAKQRDKVRETVHTSIVMTLLLGVLLTFFGILIIPSMLRLMKTPDVVYPEAHTYLTIYFGGMLGLVLYNMGSGILRAVGDSRRPFYFLVLCAVLNIVLDLTFVIVLDLGVAGVAYATVLSQGISALLVLITMIRSDGWVQLRLEEFRINIPILKKIVGVGIPAALQLAVTSFSNVFVQSYINFFGPDCMSGWTAYAKIDQLMVLPMQSLSLAATTFVGQNLGTGQVERAKKGTRTACALSMALTTALMLLVLPTAPHLVEFFNAKPAVIEFGTLFLRCLSPFYLLCCINQVYSAALRGAGNSRVPMVLMLFSFVLFRQCYLFVMANFISNTILPIAMGYPAGWLVCSVLTLVYYHFADLSHNRLVDDPLPSAH